MQKLVWCLELLWKPEAGLLHLAKPAWVLLKYSQIKIHVHTFYFIPLWLLPQIQAVVSQQMWGGRRPQRQANTNRDRLTWKQNFLKLGHIRCCFIVTNKAGVVWKHVAVHLFDDVKLKLFFFFSWWIELQNHRTGWIGEDLCVSSDPPPTPPFKAKHTIFSPPLLVFSPLHHLHLSAVHWRAPNWAQHSRCSLTSTKQKAIAKKTTRLKLYGNKTRKSLFC